MTLKDNEKPDIMKVDQEKLAQWHFIHVQKKRQKKRITPDRVHIRRI
jgi:hypothetical protein